MGDKSKKSSRTSEAKELERRTKEALPGVEELARVYGTYEQHQARVDAYFAGLSAMRVSTRSSTELSQG